MSKLQQTHDSVFVSVEFGPGLHANVMRDGPHHRRLAELLQAEQECNRFKAAASRGSIPDDCAASGEACSYAPHGRHGEIQCRYCGKARATPRPLARCDKTAVDL